MALAVFYANPFGTTATPPVEGAGLDPLLLHPSMMIHPPMLYSGYTLLTVPFAFAVGALITGRLKSDWIALTRRFALAAWLFLGIGIVKRLPARGCSGPGHLRPWGRTRSGCAAPGRRLLTPKGSDTKGGGRAAHPRKRGPKPLRQP